MSGTPFVAPRFIPVNSTGRPYPSAKLYFYRAGTTTLATVYTTSALSVASANPLTADSAGMFAAVYLDPAAGYEYKAVLQTSAGVQLWSEDNIPAGQRLYPSLSGEGTVTSYAYPPGDPRRYGAVQGTTDSTSAIQTALDCGLTDIDFAGVPYSCDSVQVPANVTVRGLNLTKYTAAGTLIAVNSGCKLFGKITGTGTTSTVERGVYPAASAVTGVYLDLDVSNFTYGVQGQPLSGTAYADAPKRWSGRLRFSTIVGATGVSEGYGLLLSPGHHCQFDIVAKTVKRHVVYLSAGSSYNSVRAVIDGCENYAAQIYAVSPQDACQYNNLDLQCMNLTESTAGQGGPISIVGLAHYNSVRIHDAGGNAHTYAFRVEGSSGGPYPKGNRLHGSTITGQYLGAEPVSLLNADSTIITGNYIEAYGTNGIIGMRRTGTNGSVHGGYVENNILNGQAQAVKGIYNECNTQPSYIGPNQIINNSTAVKIDNSTSGYMVAQQTIRRVTVTYSTSMTMDMSAGDTHVITVTDNVAFTINAPTFPQIGHRLTVVIRNTSGGAAGTATWNAVFKMSTWTQPATANSRSIVFTYDGTNWVQVAQTGADVPN